MTNDIFSTFLTELGVKHTGAFTRKAYAEHPHKYNLFGLYDLLKTYNVPSAATTVEADKDNLTNIETPFVAHFGGEFVVVTSVTDDKITYILRRKEFTLDVDRFVPSWSGTVLLAKPSNESTESDCAEHRKKSTINALPSLVLGIATVVLLVIAYLINGFGRMSISTLLVLNIVGLYLSWLLIQKQLHIYSSYGDKICTLFSKHDCNNILESRAAKIGGVLSWSEVGVGYFSANILVLLFLPQVLGTLAVINTAALLYSFWSVWYQKAKARQWCGLCLCVQALFWIVLTAHCVFGSFHYDVSQAPYVIGSVIAICVFGIAIAATHILARTFSESRMVSSLRQEINSIKVDERVFTSLLAQQAHYDVSEADSQIVFGNVNASLRLTILSNPYCNPCARMHKRVGKLLSEVGDAVMVQYIFSSFDPKLDITGKYLIAAYMQQDAGTRLRTFTEWFAKGVPQRDKFFEGLNLDPTAEEVEAEYKRHMDWAKNAKLRATPTLIVNGYALPGNYQIEDLKYLTVCI